MQVDLAQLRKMSEGDAGEMVAVPRGALREMTAQLDAFQKLKGHVHWRERVNMVLRDMAEGYGG